MKSLRPVVVLRAFWDEIIAVEPDAEFLEPVYLIEGRAYENV